MNIPIEECSIEEQTDYYFGANAVVLDEPHTYITIYEENADQFNNGEDYYINAMLSSNYSDVYFIYQGDFHFQLPERVDIKNECNEKPNQNNIKRTYSLTLDKNNIRDTSLVFSEKYFKSLDAVFIVLVKEFKIEYEKLHTSFYSFMTDAEGKPDLDNKTPLHIYYCFDKKLFLANWNKVMLKEPNESVSTLSFTFPMRRNISRIPVISVLNDSAHISPIFKPKCGEIIQTSILSPIIEHHQEKIPDYKLQQLRAQKPIISPTQVLYSEQLEAPETQSVEHNPPKRVVINTQDKKNSKPTTTLFTDMLNKKP